ncbi:MAG: DEAD/DEAH box helicase [Phocaeicola sp.]
MNEETTEYYNELYNLATHEELPLNIRYRRLRDSLERVFRSKMEGSGLQTTDLAARIAYITTQYELGGKAQYRLHTFRINSNEVLNQRSEGTQEAFLQDLHTVAQTYQSLLEAPLPNALADLLKEIKPISSAIPRKLHTIQRMRVCFQHKDERYLYVQAVDAPQEEPIKVAIHQRELQTAFEETIEQLWPHAQLNLLQVKVDEEGIHHPAFLVLEPDYLIDISSLAECYKDYGHHPANYLMSRFSAVRNAPPLLLGNIANLFLDEWIYATEEDPDYISCMKKAFRQFPIEMATCEELQHPDKEREFAQECRKQFDHIRQTVQQTFKEPGYRLKRSDAVLEPSYICEPLGIQGRLDYMQRDMSSFIEMKSGKADEYSQRGKVLPKENHQVQMLLYMAVLEFSMGKRHQQLHPYLLYTRYPLLYPAASAWAPVKRTINLRNQIVAAEYGVQLHNNIRYTEEILAEVNPLTLNEKGLNNRLWTQWLEPPISLFQAKLHRLNETEQAYFYTLYNFITKELYTSKSGDADGESRGGASGLWLSTLEEKQQAGEILYNLTIQENQASLLHQPYVWLSVPTYEEAFLPNFRVGDAVVLYERNQATDNVTNKLVFKGSIESITEHEVKVRLRAAQRNLQVFIPESYYAIERDSMDTTFRSMYAGLTAFLETTAQRRELLLGARTPQFDPSYQKQIEQAGNDFERIALKALAAKDYFLLVGPPGTGKTSRALKQMVELFHEDNKKQILLLAYTNRAVDEICQMLSKLEPQAPYIRVGNELTCDPRFRERLIENVLASCNNRKEVRNRLQACRIYVGTVASISGKPELFRLKQFDVAIVDEATQILEPQLLAILCARTADGKEGVGKFVLVGDHKQLPAVVLQRSEDTEVPEASLRSIGFENVKDSLFERLYRNHLAKGEEEPLDMLCRQGRMHPGIASFPNREFYAGKLDIVGLEHQLEDIETPIRFYPSQPDRTSLSGKTNQYEAKLVAELAVEVYQSYKDSFNASHTLGIITPYRSQIALIKQELQRTGIPELNQVSVDTVERYQGSEREVILYSFCVNYLYQLRFLPNLTQENGVSIDRKLNVALTRARKQMFITGVPELLKHNAIYRKLVEELGF